MSENILYNQTKQTCVTCKRSTADYLLSNTRSGKRECPSCDPDNLNGPLMVRSPAMGSNFSAHMAAKNARQKKKDGKRRK